MHRDGGVMLGPRMPPRGLESEVFLGRGRTAPGAPGCSCGAGVGAGTPLAGLGLRWGRGGAGAELRVCPAAEKVLPALEVSCLCPGSI